MIRQVSDIGQQYNSWAIAFKFPLQDILCRIFLPGSRLLLSVWICPADRADQMVLAHKPSDLFYIHGYRRIHVQQCHVDLPGAFSITMQVVGQQDQFEIFPVLRFPGFPFGRCLSPCVKTAS